MGFKVSFQVAKKFIAVIKYSNFKNQKQAVGQQLLWQQTGPGKDAPYTVTSFTLDLCKASFSVPESSRNIILSGTMQLGAYFEHHKLPPAQRLL
jgi:hypothetical protein